jgi:ribose 5-phosphate isomerase B
MKQAIVAFLKETFPAVTVVDLGCDSPASVDYPIFGHKVAQNVVQEKCLGIVLCGSGIGISIAANKVPGARCALCHNTTTARLCREV